jgi:hypothetical protein
VPVRMMSAGAARPDHSSGTPHIVRAPLSRQRIRWDEQPHTVIGTSFPSEYFKSRQRRGSSLDFIAQVTLHIPRAAVRRSVTGAPPRGRCLMRRYGLYSSRGRET